MIKRLNESRLGSVIDLSRYSDSYTIECECTYTTSEWDGDSAGDFLGEGDLFDETVNVSFDEDFDMWNWITSIDPYVVGKPLQQSDCMIINADDGDFMYTVVEYDDDEDSEYLCDYRFTLTINGEPIVFDDMVKLFPNMNS